MINRSPIHAPSDESSRSVSSALERAVKSALDDSSVYEIVSYGWLNETDPDPEFIGHAMWQIDQPFIDYNALLGEHAVQGRPEDIEKKILSAGEDFCGLMKASRLSIGLVLLWHGEARQNPLDESSFFWLHHTDAFLKLAIASDRLRDLLIIACTGALPNCYEDKTKRNRKYVTPFHEARDILAARGVCVPQLSEPLASLPKFSEPVFGYIKRRNEIVHQVATRMAKLMRESLAELQQRYDHEQEHGFSPRQRDSVKWGPGVDARLDTQAVDDARNELIDWYSLLIHASNSVFEIEYWTRVLGEK